jgi:transcriptional regulator with XRE-family HTH domain
MATSDDASTLGEIIRRQRELNQLSMRQFAQMVGISNPYLSQIERGLREPSERVLDSIARSLAMTADTLYAEAGMIDGEDAADGSVVRDAIEADVALTARQRRALVELYDACVAANRGGQRRRRRARSAAAEDPEAPAAEE